MKRPEEARGLLAPWAGLMTGVVALSIAHQFGSDGTFDDCLAVSPVPLMIVSVLMICATLAGAFVSWRVFRKEADAPARKVVASISIGASVFFVLAMILPMIAALMFPPCFQ